MKKIFIAAMILGLVSGSVSYAVTQNNEKERGYISISTNANAEVAPDVAEISFAIKTSDPKSMQKATVKNKEISDQVYNLLKSSIDSAKGDYIKTSNFNASPVYTYSGNKKNLDKYEVSNSIMVHTKSLDKLGDMIDKSIAAGATNVSSLNFSVSNYESQCNSLIEIASKKASTRAAIAIKSVGGSLDGIKSMDISCSENRSTAPRVYMAKNLLGATAEAMDSEASSTSISAGVVKVYANINAAFYVK